MKGLERKFQTCILFSALLFLLFACAGPEPSVHEKLLSAEAHSNAKINKLETDLSSLKYQQAELKKKIKHKDELIKRLEKNVHSLEDKVASLERLETQIKTIEYRIEYDSPVKLYEKARSLMIEQDYTSAEGLFKELIKSYPKDNLADNSLYWLAECHYSTGKFNQAIPIFKDVESIYPRSEKVPDAILKTGYSYFYLKDINKAKYYLKKVLTKYPFSPAAEKAQEKLGTFK